MGMAGAALATIIGQIVSGIMVIIYFSRFFKTVDLTLSTLIPSFQHCKDIVRLGMAPCFNQLAMMVVQIAMNNILRYYGAQSSYGSEIPLACAGIISKVNMIFYSMCIGISQGLQPIVSFNYGAKKYHRVREAYLKAAAAATIASCAAFCVFICFPGRLSAFSVLEAKSISASQNSILKYSCSLPLSTDCSRYLPTFYLHRQGRQGYLPVPDQTDYLPAAADYYSSHVYGDRRRHVFRSGGGLYGGGTGHHLYHTGDAPAEPYD